MQYEELNSFLEANPNIEWTDDEEGNLYLRHALFDAPDEKVKIEPQALEKITLGELERVLINGRNVEQITRVTGYFSRVSGWNKGKMGELAQRQRVTL